MRNESVRENSSFRRNEQELRVLRDKLSETRNTVIKLMPDDLKNILSSYEECGSRREIARWLEETADKIVEYAKPSIPGCEYLPGQYLPPRSICPLCGRGADCKYSQGFSLPIGLRRHITGWGTRVSMCPVFKVVEALAYEWDTNEFKQLELAEDAESKRQLNE